MKIALIGGTGFIGSAVLTELLARGHQVTALVRTPAKLQARAGLTAAAANALDAAQVARAVAGHDAVISAYNPGWQAPDLYARYMQGAAAIAQGVKQAGVTRLLVVGGAGSLYVAPGVQLVDTAGFREHMPPFVLPGAQAARDELTRMRGETDLAWTFISPPGAAMKAERRGSYRVGGEELLMDGDQPADIALADLAMAIVDEIEQPRHLRQRFTVAH